MKPCSISHEECRLIAERKLNSKNFEVVNFILQPLGDEKEQGFMGYYYHIKITVRVSSQPKNINLQFFCKTARENYGALSGSDIYGKEVKFYSKIYEDLTSVQMNLIGKSNLNKAVCQSYLVKDDTIVLEDLHILGFRSVPVRETLDVEHCKVALQALAYLHSAVLVREETLKKETGRTIRSIDEYGQETFIENIFRRGEVSGFYNTSRKLTMKLLEKHPKYGKRNPNFPDISRKVEQLFEEMYDICGMSEKYRNVICHGDLWATNILFRYEGDVPVEARFVDYQIIRYAPPANDVMTFLHLATTSDLRLHHGEHLLKFYHDNVLSELEVFGIKSSDVLSWEEFRESCSYLEPVGVVITSCYYPGDLVQNIRSRLANEEDYVKYLFQDRTLALQEYEKDPALRSRTDDAINSLVDVSLSWKK